MKVIESIDIFGTTFNFSIFEQTRYKTIFGGFLTFLCLGVCVIFTLFFGKDFFYRTNPKILTQYVQPKKMEQEVKLPGKLI